MIMVPRKKTLARVELFCEDAIDYNILALDASSGVKLQ